MAIMGSSSQNKQIFDEIRGIWVAATPEEIVRQKLLHRMVHQLKFPKELIAVEKSIEEIVPLFSAKSRLPARRADIICFAKGAHPGSAFYPLLLIECKQGAIDEGAMDQVLGYNHFIQAYFVAVANDVELRLGHYNSDLKNYDFISFLPTYHQLIDITNYGKSSSSTIFSDSQRS